MSLDKNTVREILIGQRLEAIPVFQDIQLLDTRPTVRPEGFRISKFAFNTFAKFENTEVLGCGEDAFSEKDAFEKSISEAIERAVLLMVSQNSREKMTSNGWAAHITLEDAALSAIYELVERDAALLHWLNNMPMYRIDESEILSREFINDLRRTEFQEAVVLVSFDFSGPVVTVLLRDRLGHCVSGHASGETLEKAVLGATIEACRSAHHFQRFEFYSETKRLLDGDKLQEISPGMHSLMYAYHEPLPAWLIGKKMDLAVAKKKWLNKNKSVLELLEESKFTAHSSNDRYIVRAENPFLQTIFWGPTEDAIMRKVMNLDRLRNTNINLRPHMVG